VVHGLLAAVQPVSGTRGHASVTAVTGGVQDTLDEVAKFGIKFYTAGQDLIGGMVQGVLDFVQPLIDAVIAAIKAAIEAAKRYLGMESPSKLTREMGHDTIGGMALGVEDEAGNLDRALTGALTPFLRTAARLPSLASRAALAPAPVLGGNTTNIYNNNYASQFDFGRNNVGSPVDLARMEGMIRRTVRQELRKR
jgi:hypothetical protein